jgi:hypothetical protein
VLRKLGGVDLHVGPHGALSFDIGQWEDDSQTIEVPPVQPGPMYLTAPVAGWIGQTVVFGVRVSNPKGRWSNWSNMVTLRVVPPLPAPTALAAKAVPEGVRLTWRMPTNQPNVTFRVFRRSGKQEESEQVAQVEGREWVDKDTRYGSAYTYSVQAVLQADDANAESGRSNPAAITLEDRFPPAVPAGLTGVAGLGTIELAWERNQEPDFAGYRVYRAGSSGEWRVVADLLETPSYSDHDVVSGEKYSYAVSSIDKLGNESARSAPVEVTAP